MAANSENGDGFDSQAMGTAWKQVRLDLENNYNAFKLKAFPVKRHILEFLGTFQKHCRDFTSYDASIIAAAHPAASDGWICPIPVPDYGTWESRKLGIKLSFEPLGNLSLAAEAARSTNAPRAVASSPLPPMLASPMASPTRQTLLPTGIREHEQATVELMETEDEEPLPSPTDASFPMPQAHATTSIDAGVDLMLPPKSKHRISKTRPAKRRSTRLATSATLLCKPITKKHAAKSHSWIFDYDHLGNPGALYLLRCPSPSCDSPVFPRHPLRKGRAEAHLKRCRVPFKNERDLVIRYARQVVLRSSAPQADVTKDWARKANSNLIASNERELEEENFAD